MSTRVKRIVAPWKHNPATDRGYAGRIARAEERGQFTEPGTAPNVMDPEKVARKRKAAKS